MCGADFLEGSVCCSLCVLCEPKEDVIHCTTVSRSCCSLIFFFILLLSMPLIFTYNGSGVMRIFDVPLSTLSWDLGLWITQRI